MGLLKKFNSLSRKKQTAIFIVIILLFIYGGLGGFKRVLRLFYTHVKRVCIMGPRKKYCMLRGTEKMPW